MSDDTVAYTRPHVPTWRERTEHVLTRLGDFYFMLWDIMAGVAAVAFLIWLSIVIPHR